MDLLGPAVTVVVGVVLYLALSRQINLTRTTQEQLHMDLTKLQADVTAETSVDAAVETLLTGLADQIKAAGTDQTKLDALTAQMESNAAALGAAVTANTPATTGGSTTTAGGTTGGATTGTTTGGGGTAGGGP